MFSKKPETELVSHDLVITIRIYVCAGTFLRFMLRACDFMKKNAMFSARYSSLPMVLLLLSV